MNTPIAIKNRREAAALHRAMADPTVRAFVLIMGELLALPSDHARRRVLTFIIDKASEPDEMRENAEHS
jgi:hypothetical protein